MWFYRAHTKSRECQCKGFAYARSWPSIGGCSSWWPMRIIHFSSPLSVDLSFPCFLVSNVKKHTKFFSQVVRAFRRMLLFHGVEWSWYSTGLTFLTGAVACFSQMACFYRDIWWDYSDTHNDVLQHLWPIQRALSFLLKQVQTNFQHVDSRYNYS